MNAFPRLRIGNQTAYSARSWSEPFEFALDHGFTCFEFFPDRGPAGMGGWGEDDLDAGARSWIRESAAAAGMELTVHAPLAFNPLHWPDHPRLAATVTFAVEIGATLVNVHLDSSLGAEAFAHALRPTLEATAAAGLKLALENTVWTGPGDFNETFAALRKLADVPTAHAGMCFDLGHANLAAGYHHDTWRYLDDLEVPICHLHLHENFGDRDSHLTLFTGPSRSDSAGLAGVLQRLKERSYDGCAILEQWPEPPELLVIARDRLKKLPD